MTRFNHTKSIVAAIATGALLIAAPAGASVLEPVTNGWNPDQSYAGSVTAIAPPSDQNTQPSGYPGTVTALAPPTGQAPAESTRPSSPLLAGVEVPGGNPVGTVPQQPSPGNGFDLGYAAIGAGAALLLVCLALLGSSMGSRQSRSKAGRTVSAAA